MADRPHLSRSVPTSLVLGCLLVLSVPSIRADEAHAILERAIKAHGGEDRVARTKIGRIKADVEASDFLSGHLKGTYEEVFHLPKRCRRTVDLSSGGQSRHMEMAVNDKRAWSRQGQAPPQDIPVAGTAQLDLPWYAALVQLLRLREKDARLTALPEEKRDGRTLVGFHFVSGRDEADLYFDRSTGLLARARRPLMDMSGGRLTPGDIVYDNYRDVDGIRYPMRIKAVAGPGQFQDFTITSVEFLDKIDDSVFAKPAVPRPPEPASGERTSGSPASESEGGSPGETPPRWDIRLIVTTLAAGAVVAAVWLYVRRARQKQGEAPAP